MRSAFAASVMHAHLNGREPQGLGARMSINEMIQMYWLAYIDALARKAANIPAK